MSSLSFINKCGCPVENYRKPANAKNVRAIYKLWIISEMNYSDFLAYKETPCKFKLKSGKEVYGVIWEELNDDKIEYLFASSSIHNRYKKASARQDQLRNGAVYRLSLEDVIFAEPLSLAY